MSNRIAEVRAWWVWMHAAPTGPRTLSTTISWWESRRLSYNLLLLAVGLPSLLVFFAAILASGTLEPGEDAVEPLALLVAPVLANLAYTAGWLVEGALLWWRPRRPLGPRLMRAGLLFSLFVLLFPAVSWIVLVAVQVVRRALRAT